jgi:hypothetical protein
VEFANRPVTSGNEKSSLRSRFHSPGRLASGGRIKLNGLTRFGIEFDNPVRSSGIEPEIDAVSFVIGMLHDAVGHATALPDRDPMVA